MRTIGFVVLTLVVLTSGQLLQVCKPGSPTRTVDCNQCFCIADGTGEACTRKACEKSDVQEGDDTVNKARKSLKTTDEGVVFQCTPGERFSLDGCNWCTCRPDGRNAACTLMGCFESVLEVTADNPIEGRNAKYLCTPGETLKVHCNNCTCMTSGRDVVCTMFPCY